MIRCRWNSDAADYLTPDGEPCRRDEYGDPTKHCAGRSCSWHVGAAEATCARCIAKVRQDLRSIVDLAALLPSQAVADGVDSEAASLAGPSVDPEAWSWRKATAKATGAWHLSLEEDDDEHHPHRVLGAWARMVTEDYAHEMPALAGLAWCADYLDRQLHRIAQDDEQDFPLLGRELRKCRQHLEAVLHNDTRPDRGAPCPECESFVRLQRRYGHWCEDADCERIHHADDSGDWWVCPRDRAHRWAHEDYERWIAERQAG